MLNLYVKGEVHFLATEKTVKENTSIDYRKNTVWLALRKEM